MLSLPWENLRPHSPSELGSPDSLARSLPTSQKFTDPSINSLRGDLECLLEASWACATKKLLDAKGHLVGPTESYAGLQTKGHSPEVSLGKTFCGFYWLPPQQTAGNGFGLVWGKAEGLQGKKQTSADLARLAHPEHSTFPTVRSPASLSSGVPGDLPLSHRGPFLVRALGPLSVPETETVPLMSPHTLL